MLELTKDNFTKILEENNLVLVDFWAEWCGPCRALTPKFEEWSKKYTNALFAKINVDEQPDLASSHKISSIPTVILFKNGKQIKKIVGLPNEKEIGECCS